MRPHRLAASIAAVVLSLSGIVGVTGQAGAAQPSGVPIPPFADVPEYRANSSHTGVYQGPGPVEQPVLIWSRASADAINSQAVLADGMLLVGSTDHNFYALDARTGAEQWRFRADDEFTPFASAAEGVVVAASADGVLHALDVDTGAERWSHRDIGPSTDIVDGVVYAGGTDDHVYGLDLVTGEARFSWAAPADVAYVTVADQTMYASIADGRLYAISVADGAEQWHVQTLAGSPGIAEIDGDTVFVSGAVGDSVTPAGELYVIDRASGAVRWRFRTPTGNQITLGATANGTVYAGTIDGNGLYAFPIKADVSGAAPQPSWHTALEAQTQVNKNQALTGDLLYVPIQDPNEILAVGAADGAIRWHVSLGGTPNGTLASGGMLFTTDQSGAISAFAEPSLKDAVGATVSGPLSAVTQVLQPADPFTVVGTLRPSTTTLQTMLAFDVGPDGLIYALDMKPSVTVIDPATGNVVRSWGHKGTGQGEFDLVGEGNLVVSPDGTVTVSDSGNHRLEVFNSDGTYIRQMGSFGTGDGQFGKPSRLATDDQDSVYVLDDPSNALTKFDRDGAFAWRAPGVLGWSQSAVQLSDGSIAWLRENGRVQRIDSATGARIDAWGKPGHGTGELGDSCVIAQDSAANEYIFGCLPVRTQVFNAAHQLIAGAYAPRDHVVVPVFGPRGAVYGHDPEFSSDNIYILKDNLLTP